MHILISNLTTALLKLCIIYHDDINDGVDHDDGVGANEEDDYDDNDDDDRRATALALQPVLPWRRDR